MCGRLAGKRRLTSQEAKKKPASDQVAAAMHPLFARFAGSNRAGCAAHYIGHDCVPAGEGTADAK